MNVGTAFLPTHLGLALGKEELGGRQGRHLLERVLLQAENENK